MIKWLKIKFFKSRMKHHYLMARGISSGINCGETLLMHISVAYSFHKNKTSEYQLKLRALGEPI